MPRRAGSRSRITGRTRHGARQAVQGEAAAGRAWPSTRRASPRPRCSGSSRRSSCRTSIRRSLDARARRQGRAHCSTPTSRRAARWRAGCKSALEEALAGLPIPKVMSYAGPGHYYNNEKFVRPAHRLLAMHGDHVVPVAALGLARGTSHAGPPLPLAERHQDRNGRRLRADAGSRGEGHPVVRRAPREHRRAARRRGRRRDADHARRAARRGHRAGRVAGRLRRHVRRRVPRGAAGVPDPHDAAEPALLRAGRRRRQARQPVPAGEQPRDAGPARDRRRQRARAARAARRREVLLRPGPEAAPRRPRRPAPQRRPSQQARHAGGARRPRSASLAARISPLVGADAKLADRAALLAKADLLTDMVGEFPELQGIMGRYYAEHDGEPPLVAAAIEQHYWPKAAGAALPESPVAQAVALADKLETHRRHVRHRAGPDRRQGPVRAAARGARRHPHPDRARPVRRRSPRSSTSRSRRSMRCRP